MYENFFGFRERPFNITPNPRFIFLSKTHQEVFAHLIYGLQNHAGFIEITGEVGTGKTTILRALFDQLDENDYRLALIFNPRLSVLDLLRSINQEFGLPVGDGTHLALTDQLNRFLLEENRAGRTPVLVIDEAQNLSSDVLEQIRLLSNLETDTDKLIQIVLVGQPELGRNLDRPELRQLSQRITVRYHLGRLDFSDCCAYIRHRLKVAGGGDPELFTPAALKLIFRHSGGLPRLINVLCDRSCLVAFTEGQDKVDQRAVRQARMELQGNEARRGPQRTLPWMAILAPALLVLMAGLWWSQHPPAALPEPLIAAQRQSADVAPGASALPASPVAPPPLVPAPQPHPAQATPPALPAPAPVVTPVRVKPSPPDRAPQATPASKPVKVTKVPRSEPLSTAEVASLSALNELLRRWQRQELPADRQPPADLPALFASRGLELAEYTGDFRQLLRLNTPALIEVRGRAGALSWRALVEQRANSWRVAPDLDGRELLGGRELQALWTGRAWIPWEDLHQVADTGDASARAAKLQNLLISAGYREEPADGHFDRATAKAVGRFQADHGIVVDGSVGPYTLIMLYQAASGNRVPQLLHRSGE